MNSKCVVWAAIVLTTTASAQQMPGPPPPQPAPPAQPPASAPPSVTEYLKRDDFLMVMRAQRDAIAELSEKINGLENRIKKLESK